MNLSPEWKLVLCSARAALIGGEGEGLTSHASSVRVDWPRAADLACQNRVGPLVHSALRRVPLPPDARPALEILKSAYVATAARNAVLFRELTTVLGALSAERIPVIVLKGAALADTVYAERALRPMADIDLLIREEDLEEAERRLGSIGYEAAHDPRTKEDLRGRHHHWVFRSARPGASDIPIELHWNLDPPGRPAAWDIPALFERAEAASIAGADALVLCPEDFLLHLCVHLCRHRFNGGVIALCDIAATISAPWRPARLDPVRAARRRGPRFGVRVRPSSSGRRPDSSRRPRAGSGALWAPRDQTTAFSSSPAREFSRRKGTSRGAAQLLLRWRHRNRENPAGVFKRPLAGAGPNSLSVTRLAAHLRRYVPWLWALARHPSRVARIAGREAHKSELDSWCASPSTPSARNDR